MRTGKTFSGRQFLMIIAGAFGIVIAANLTLAYFAINSFPGLEVANTYVASQNFDARRKAQEALGWHISLNHDSQGVTFHFRDADGKPVIPETVSLRVGAAANAGWDRDIRIEPWETGFRARLDLPAGNWIAQITATAANGTVFSERHKVIIR